MNRNQKMGLFANETAKIEDTRTSDFGLRTSDLGLLSFFILFFLLSSSNLPAQCAMCRAVAESSPDEHSIAVGLNAGILYLLATPYLLMGGIVFIFFRKQIAEKIKSLKK